MSKSPLHRLVHDESGMTLMELLNVVVILGILLLIAVPSYLGLKDRTYKTAAKANLRSVIPEVIQYGIDNTPNSRDDPNSDPTDVGYSNISASALQTHYDPTLNTAVYSVTGTANGYCVYTWVDAWTAAQAGPGLPITMTLNANFNPALCS
jgi:prepilin-type N-terminal cleavage/methylation domain-containing protein